MLGRDILKEDKLLQKILPAFRHPHESDVSVYPAGLTGYGMPRAAQVLAVAEAFEAMTSDGP